MRDFVCCLFGLRPCPCHAVIILHAYASIVAVVDFVVVERQHRWRRHSFIHSFIRAQINLRTNATVHTLKTHSLLHDERAATRIGCKH